MKLYERLRATVTATVDNAVSQIENHDAVVEAALKDTRAAAAKARARLARVVKDGDALQHKLASLQQSASQWEARARSVADADEQKALQCVQRRNTRRQEAQHAGVALIRHGELETSAIDTLETEFVKLENETQLKAELDALRREATTSAAQDSSKAH